MVREGESAGEELLYILTTDENQLVKKVANEWW
jgi:hypothetical protein